MVSVNNIAYNILLFVEKKEIYTSGSEIEKIVKAKTRLLQAKSAFQLLETNYKRMKTLVEKGIVSDRELGMEYKLKISKAELRLAQIELDLLQNSLK